MEVRTMSEQLAPALTPEEWETKDYRQRPRVLDEWANQKPERRPEDDPNEYVAKLGLSYDGCVIAMNRAHDFVLVPPPARSALAAFALHEQPFGFTRDDAAVVRRAAETAGTRTAAPDPELLRSLADRIEALLPPSPG
jgi:hypothetical protein